MRRPPPPPALKCRLPAAICYSIHRSHRIDHTSTHQPSSSASPRSSPSKQLLETLAPPRSSAMDVEKRKGQMHSLAFGQAMAAAAEDYKRVRQGSDRPSACPAPASPAPSPLATAAPLNAQAPIQPAPARPPRPAAGDAHRASRRRRRAPPRRRRRGRPAGRSRPGEAARRAPGAAAARGGEARGDAAQGARCVLLSLRASPKPPRPPRRRLALARAILHCFHSPPPRPTAGAYEEVSEGDFLGVCTQTERVVAHFYHRDFERCRIMDKHLAALAPKHFGTRFIKLSAPVRAWGGVVHGRAPTAEADGCVLLRAPALLASAHGSDALPSSHLSTRRTAPSSWRSCKCGCCPASCSLSTAWRSTAWPASMCWEARTTSPRRG